MAIPAGMFKPSTPEFFVFRVHDAAGSAVARPYGMWANSEKDVRLAAVEAGYLRGGDGRNAIIKRSDATTAAEHFGLTEPITGTALQALDPHFNWDSYFR